jgi:hypothetical protein
MMKLGYKISSLRLNWDSVVKWGLIACTSTILSGLMLCVYWLLIDRSAPVTVHYGEVVRFEHQANDSWVMIIRWHGDRHRKCWGNSKRWISGDFVLPLPDIPYPPDRPDQEIGRFTWEVPIEIPSYYVSTGHTTGQYSIRIAYACNPLQEYLFPVIVTPKPVEFEIPTDMPMKKVNLDASQIENFLPGDVGK